MLFSALTLRLYSLGMAAPDWLRSGFGAFEDFRDDFSMAYIFRHSNMAKGATPALPHSHDDENDGGEPDNAQT
jgi:hypothetical protein